MGRRKEERVMSPGEGNLARNLAAEKIAFSRIFDAPRDLVFKAFTEPEKLMRWWGPKGFTTPSCTVDLRIGGVFHYCMRSPEGKNYWGKGIYREIVLDRRLAYLDMFSDEKGGTVSPAAHGLSTAWPASALVTVTFDDAEGGTKVTLEHDVGSAPPSEIDMCRQGWGEMFDRLGDCLPDIR
ncbi:MAG TPA: SRPBCC domain-containing protein [Candidatus Deferrimicrobiaceae bacterium]